MPTAEERTLDRMLTDFELLHDTASAHPGRNLRALIEQTPAMKGDILESIRRGNLDRFEDLPYAGPVGTYDADAKALAVSVDQLKSADRNVQAANTLRFTLGHELQHGVNRQDILDQDATMRSDAAAIARSPSPHDYTASLQAYNATSRRLESTAEIAGFNTLAESVRRGNPNATLKDLYDASPNDMQMYIDVDLGATPARYTPKAGLSIGADLTIDPSKRENVEAIGTLFYDANGYPPQEIGRALGMAHKAEAAAQAASGTLPDIRVDLKALGVSGPLPHGFTDSSKPRLLPGQEAAQADPRSAGHPDHDYYQLLRGKLPDSVPDNAVAHAMYLAKHDGMGDPSKVDPAQVAYANGHVWVGGSTPGYRVAFDPAQSPPMAQVNEQLETQRQQRELQAPPPQVHAHAPHAL
jgi:hypothetical protein